MNEKEIIEILKSPLLKSDGYERHQRAIDGILDLYQKEKEKNTELKTLIERNLKYTHELEKDLFENCSNYVISKDKINAKIEDKKKEAERHIECVDVTEGQAMYKILEELQGELLEEE